MTKEEKFKIIKPKPKKLKVLLLRVFFYFMGYGFQTLPRVDPGVKEEMDRWPDTFIFLISVLHGPRLVVEKRNGTVLYKGEKEVYNADIELCFKNVEYAYKSFTGRISIPEVAYQNRQFVKGDINIMMSIIRVMNLIIATLFPKFIAKFYIKRVPKFTLKRLVARGALYFNAIAGIIK